MKILHLNCNYAGTKLHQTMMNHFNNKYEHFVFCPVYDVKHLVIEPNNNVCITECFKKWDRIFFDYKQNKIIRRVESEYDISGFNCIHAYTLFTDGNTAMELSKKYGIPYVVAVRSTDIDTFLKYKPYLRRRAFEIINCASAVFFLSESYREQIEKICVRSEYYDEFRRKSYIIPNGIDDFWLKNINLNSKSASIHRVENNKLNVVFAGKINARKNVLATQKALELLRKQGWEVVFSIAGAIENQSIFKEIMRYPYTSYCGQLNNEQLLELYRQSDVFVMPSLSETFGLVYAEAISQGMPVVYSKNQGFDKQFLEGEVGFHADANSATSVMKAILKVAEQYKTIVPGIAEKSKKYDWQNICNSYVDIYNNILIR